MRLMLSGNTSSLRKILTEHPVLGNHLGLLHTPKHVMFGFDLPMAADNDAFSGFNEERYISMLVRLSYMPIQWVSAPDVVGNAKQTLKLFYDWWPIITQYHLPTALVAQDGIEYTEIPWDKISAIFIGGTTGFKFSLAVEEIIKAAQLRKKLVHIGRVNSFDRIQHFFNLNVDSFDGSSASRYTTQLIRHLSNLVNLKLEKQNGTFPTR